MLLCYEATRDLELEDVEIDTPIAHTTAKQLKGKKLAVVPGSAFYTDSAVDQPFVRLNFSTPTKEQIDRGVAVMAEVLAEMTK